MRKRYVSEAALVCLKLEASFRKRIFDLVLTHPEMTTVRPVEAVQIDMEQARREVHENIDELKQAEQMVTVDAAVMGGVPVIAGARIPVGAPSDMPLGSAEGRQMPGILHMVAGVHGGPSIPCIPKCTTW